MSSKLMAKDLIKRFGRRTVVNSVSFDIKSGEIVGLLGPNGAGKTTSFYMIIGLIKNDGGKIYINDTEISNLSMHTRARMGISYLPQEPSVFRKLTVEENLWVVLENMPLTYEQRKQKAQELMEQLGISHLAEAKSFTLSGGERRRVEIARALVTEPKFILLDEPFSGIDPLAVLDIQSIIKELKRLNIGVIITDHNVRETLGICDRAYILSDGVIQVTGTSEEIVNNDVARKAYLGENFKL
ncbi:MAG: LPS export ABC transporter ATP-binding protein [Proteobacteria bacterium]|nr:LPS export ABC transporter ATP-binding protein [Pseudomonadota bacterium]